MSKGMHVDKADPCLCPSPGGVPPKRPHGHHFASLICFPTPHQTRPICKNLPEPASLISVNSPRVCRTLRGGALGVLFRIAFLAQESADLGKGRLGNTPPPRRGQRRGSTGLLAACGRVTNFGRAPSLCFICLLLFCFSLFQQSLAEKSGHS